MLSPLLYSLFTHDCVAKHDSNPIIMFADDTTVVGLITDNDETAYREEVRDQAVWCQDNNLSFNVSKTKEMIVNYRKRRAKYAPIHIKGAGREFQVSWCSHYQQTIMVQTPQGICAEGTTMLFPPRETEKIWHGSPDPQKFYICTIESILTRCLTAWYGNCSASDYKALQMVKRTAQYITGFKLPAIQDLYTTQCQRKGPKIVKDSCHPSH